MLDWLKKRLKEPTTFIGAALLAQSAMVLTKADPAHTEAVAGALNNVAEPLASGDYVSAATIGLGALMGVLMSEKK